MSKRKERFTPGPWELFTGDGTTNWHTLVIRRREPKNGIEQLPVDICACQNCLCDASEKPANASLIAASPEMYEFIKSLTSFGGQIALATLGEDGMKIYNEAMRVLAKARGEDAE